MREILFRGKIPSESQEFDDGYWVEGYYTRFNGKEHRIYTGYAETDCGDYYPDWCNVRSETVGEFTGLYNAGKQRIFEDDIVRFEGELYRVRREDETPGGYWASTAYILQHIGWDDYMSFVDTIDDYSNEICVELIGNIHDNPELLEVR
jgi:uncharacterized phage protein (TIGR01671 family)